jgi:hypothetical protein
MTLSEQRVRIVFDSVVSRSPAPPNDVQLALLLEDGETLKLALPRVAAGKLVKRLLLLGVLPLPE